MQRAPSPALGVFVGLALAAVACSDETVSPQSGATTSTTTTASTSTSDGGAGGGGMGGFGGATGGAGGSGGHAGGAGQLGDECDVGTCEPGLLCDFPFHACAPDPQWFNLGHCADPAVCPPSTGDQVCGCDGAVYATPCDAWAAGTDLGATSCSAEVVPQGRFPCGIYFCDPDKSYCWRGDGDTGDVYFECRPLPAACDPAAPDCACLDGEIPFETFCSIVDGKGVQGLQLEQPLI